MPILFILVSNYVFNDAETDFAIVDHLLSIWPQYFKMASNCAY